VQWIEITVKFPNKCRTCKDLIKKDQTALWSKGIGIKHIVCPKVRTQSISISPHDEYVRRPFTSCHSWHTKYDWKVNETLASNSVSCSNARCHICNDVFIENTFISWHPEQFKGCHKECRLEQKEEAPKEEERVIRRMNVSPEDVERFQQMYESESIEDYKARTGY